MILIVGRLFFVVFWFFVGFKLRELDRVIVEIYIKVVKLIIREIIIRDIGEYIFELKNVIGIILEIIKVIIFGKDV